MDKKTLRKQYTEETNKQILIGLGDCFNDDYIDWLEDKIKNLGERSEPVVGC